MPKFMPEDRYKPFPSLQRAIKLHRLARIACDINRNARTIYDLSHARHVEKTLRAKLAPELRAHREALAWDIEHRRRYAKLYARRSRTLDTARELRQARNARRRQAREAAESKRASNLRKRNLG